MIGLSNKRFFCIHQSWPYFKGDAFEWIQYSKSIGHSRYLVGYICSRREFTEAESWGDSSFSNTKVFVRSPSPLDTLTRGALPHSRIPPTPESPPPPVRPGLDALYFVAPPGAGPATHSLRASAPPPKPCKCIQFHPPPPTSLCLSHPCCCWVPAGSQTGKPQLGQRPFDSSRSLPLHNSGLIPDPLAALCSRFPSQLEAHSVVTYPWALVNNEHPWAPFCISRHYFQRTILQKLV